MRRFLIPILILIAVAVTVPIVVWGDTVFVPRAPINLATAEVNGVLPVANGGTASATAGSGEHDFNAYNAANVAATTALSETTVTNASTATTGSKITTDIAGVGAGNFVAMLCTDGTACTVQNGGTIAAGTVVTWSVTTACATTDPGTNINAHMTTP